jgi:hypothetical protein
VLRLPDLLCPALRPPASPPIAISNRDGVHEKKSRIRVDRLQNTQIAKELNITPMLDKLLEYKRNWIQNVNRMPRNRLPRVMKHYSPTGKRIEGRPLKRLLDA